MNYTGWAFFEGRVIFNTSSFCLSCDEGRLQGFTVCSRFLGRQAGKLFIAPPRSHGPSPLLKSLISIRVWFIQMRQVPLLPNTFHWGWAMSNVDGMRQPAGTVSENARIEAKRFK